MKTPSSNCRSLKKNGENMNTRLMELRKKSFKDQAIWFLNNASGIEGAEEKCNLVVKIEHKCSSMNSNSGGKDYVIDELTAHRLVEFSMKQCPQLGLEDTNIVSSLRSFMEDASIKSNQRRISLGEFLIYLFGCDWKRMLDREGCDLDAETQAREQLQQAKDELEKLTETAKNAAKMAEYARVAEMKAIEDELAAARAAEAANETKLAASQLQKKSIEALELLNLREETTQQRRQELEENSKRGSIVARNKAVAELAILLSEDPMQLRTMRIKQEAIAKKANLALKKSNVEAVSAESALERAKQARRNSIELREKSLAALGQIENSIPSAQRAFDKMSVTLDEIMAKREFGNGSIFFIKAELKERKKYLPKNKFEFVVSQKQAARGGGNVVR